MAETETPAEVGLEVRLTEVIAGHESLWGSDDYTRCVCGVLTGTLGGLRAHVVTMLTGLVAAEVERAVGTALEEAAVRLTSKASDASYAYPEEVTDTYLDAARVVREGATR